MKIRFLALGSVVSVGGALLVGGSMLTSVGQVACSSGSSTSTPSDITIGFSDALTNGLAGLGTPLQKGIVVPEGQINQVGVLGGRKIKFKVVDDASDKGPVVQGVVNNFINQDHVPAIIGPLSSGQVSAVQGLTLAAHVVEISPSATSPLLKTAQPAKDRYLFLDAPPDDFQGKAITKLVYDGVMGSGTNTADAGSGDGGAPSNLIGGGCRKFFTVNGDDDYGNALTGVVIDSMKAKAGTTHVNAPGDKVATSLATDYKMLTQKLVAAQPDCLVLVAYSDVGAEFLREMKSAIAADTSGHDWSKFFVSGSDGEYDSAFIPNGQADHNDPKSANSTEGCYGTSPDPAPDTPEYKTFRSLWQASFPGAEPDAYASNTYDAAILIALAIQKAGTATDGQKIRDALYDVTDPGTTSNPATTFGPDKYIDAVASIQKGIKTKYKGASGPLIFDENGTVTGDYIVWHVEKQTDGTFAFATVGKITSAELQ